MLKLARLRPILAGTLDLLLTKPCVLCGLTLPADASTHLCRQCEAALPVLPPSCPRCALPLADSGECPICPYQALLPNPDARALAALPHNGAARYLVHRLKFQHGFREGDVLADLLSVRVRDAYAKREPLPQVLLPVPLSWRRQFGRGYNQAFLLAQRLARNLGLEVHSGAFTRRHRPPQQTLSRDARLELPSDTLRLTRPAPFRHVAIVDDVLTTGRTVQLMAECLDEAGVERADVWCVTRAL